AVLEGMELQDVGVADPVGKDDALPMDVEAAPMAPFAGKRAARKRPRILRIAPARNRLILEAKIARDARQSGDAVLLRGPREERPGPGRGDAEQPSIKADGGFRR